MKPRIPESQEDMNLMEPVKKEPLTLYRGFAAAKSKEFSFLRSIEDFVEYVFNEPFPGLSSPVSQRYNATEAYSRYREHYAAENTKGLRTAVVEHYRGEREFSFFVTGTESEEQAVFFAGTSWRDNPFGLVARFRRDHDYEVFAPADNLHPYREVLVASQVEPREIDKVFIVGCKAPNHMLIEFIYKRGEDGRVRKYRNPDHMGYTYLRGVMWTPESFFTPPLKGGRTEHPPQ